MKSCKVLAASLIAITLTAGFSLKAAEESVNSFSGEPVEVNATTSSTSETTQNEDATKDKKEEKKGEFPIQGTVQGDSLRLRSWPWGPVIGMFNTGMPVTITGESGEFYEVTINGQSGFMHKNYVSTSKAPASRIAPYYPGNTASGGYLPKSEGITQSESGAKSGSTPSGTRSTPSAAESGALASYTGGQLPSDKFIALFGPVARESMRNTGVPASVTIAQAILETGWGRSSIGDAKNLFGIKGTGPAGTTRVSTQECYNGQFVTIQDGFRRYNSWQESIDDHAKLLQNSRYGGALNQYKQTKNADNYARGIHQAGYATDPNYANKLINLMKSYNLYQWDI
ncbi:MAG: hypothetical protein GX031_08945 [Candidatus Riflebacteria bacterium]|nr:hypothetical protein [Candidatus Riflebacteria bacterium]